MEEGVVSSCQPAEHLLSDSRNVLLLRGPARVREKAFSHVLPGRKLQLDDDPGLSMLEDTRMHLRIHDAGRVGRAERCPGRECDDDDERQHTGWSAASGHSCSRLAHCGLSV